MVFQISLSSLQSWAQKMAKCAFYLILLTLATKLSCVRGKQLEHFAQALMLNLGNTNPALVLDLEQNPEWSWTSLQTTTIIAATNDPNEIKTIITNITLLLDEDEIDFVFFVNPIEEQLVSTLAEELGRLRPKVTMLIPFGYKISYPMRLDSRLFFYKLSGKSVTVFEKYFIR